MRGNHRAERFDAGETLTASFFTATASPTRGTAFIAQLVQHPTDVLTSSG
ncbi:MAG: hypothetical protein K2X54_06125 [Methylobacterium organophilum]|nr:hypothetical protein [Methylobacterium organophilum]